MSVPPPSFSQYGTPPPGGGGGNFGQPPKNSSGGCWKAAGITCGVLLLLGIIAVVVTVNAVKHAVHSHTGIFGKIMEVPTTTANGLTIQKAIVAYHKAQGKYPATLTDLVANGSLDGKLLHSPLDPNPDPGHISWTYHKPTADTSEDAPLLSLHYSITVPGQSTPQATNSEIVINLDGTMSSNSGSPPASSS